MAQRLADQLRTWKSRHYGGKPLRKSQAQSAGSKPAKPGLFGFHLRLIPPPSELKYLGIKNVISLDLCLYEDGVVLDPMTTARLGQMGVGGGFFPRSATEAIHRMHNDINIETDNLPSVNRDCKNFAVSLVQTYIDKGIPVIISFYYNEQDRDIINENNKLDRNNIPIYTNQYKNPSLEALLSVRSKMIGNRPDLIYGYNLQTHEVLTSISGWIPENVLQYSLAHIPTVIQNGPQ